MSTDSSTIAVKCFFVLVNSRMLVFLVMEIISFKHLKSYLLPGNNLLCPWPMFAVCEDSGNCLTSRLEVIQNKFANLHKTFVEYFCYCSKKSGEHLSIIWYATACAPASRGHWLLSEHGLGETKKRQSPERVFKAWALWSSLSKKGSRSNTTCLKICRQFVKVVKAIYSLL